MLTTFLLYVAFVFVPGVKAATGLFAFIGGVAAVTVRGVGPLFLRDFEDDEERREAKILAINAAAKRFLPIWVACFVLHYALPDREDVGYLVGGYFAIETISAASGIEGIGELPENVVGAINKFLGDYKEEKE